ncbi:hypothetical protein BGX33_008853 [Mortierella sp. NVP41]|nr:hypothetical protein BGX33_008853 [Mortierella sp. NVP41]
MVKRDPNAHQSNHYKSTHHSGGKANKKSGGKAGKGNKSINQLLGIGKPGPHLAKHKKKQEAKLMKRQQKQQQQQQQSNRHNNNNLIDCDRHLYGAENVSTFVNRNIGKNAKKKAKKRLAASAAMSMNNNSNNINNTLNTNNNAFLPTMNNNSNNDINAPPSSSEFGEFTLPSFAPSDYYNASNDSNDSSNDQEYERDLEYSYEPVPAHESATEAARAVRRKAKKERRKLERAEAKRAELERAAQIYHAVAGTRPPQNVQESRSSIVPLPMAGAQPPFIARPRPPQPASESRSAPESKSAPMSRSNGDTKDEMQRGDDFIGFGGESSDEEAALAPIISTARITRKEPSHAGEKRKRSSDNGSDTEGATGPPPGCPWMGHRQYSKMPSVPMMLTQELKDFVDYLSPTPEEHQVRKYVTQWIAKVVSDLWPDSELHVFGSYDTQLYLPSSDLDLVVLRPREFNKGDLPRLKEHLIRANVAVARDITVIGKAKVPIIKLKERVSQIPIDISFNITNGIESAQIVRKYMETTPALRPLTMLIKHFLMLKGHNEVFQGGIGSYTTMIMILSFLQMHPQVQANKIDPEDNLGVLLIEFFELYGLCFNYQNVGLSVANGGSYFAKPQNTHGGHERLLLSSIDPNDPTNDTAKGSYNLRQIREVFVGAYGALTKNVQRRHRDLFENGRGHRSSSSSHYRFDEHNRVPADSVGRSSGLHHQTQVSLIKDAFSIPTDVMLGRQHLEAVFYSGHFQDLFDDPRGAHGLIP